jgi:hypothetical protein
MWLGLLNLLMVRFVVFRGFGVFGLVFSIPQLFETNIAIDIFFG